MLIAPTSDHYSDRILSSPKTCQPSGNWEFDGVGLARAIIDGRHHLGWSTRQLSRRAGISQAYVVALERSRTTALRKGPTPTVDVVARLAEALEIAPVDLFSAALRQVARHVLLVVEEDQQSPLEHARSVTQSKVDTWIWAASSPGKQLAGSDGQYSINLRRDRPQAYEPALIARSLSHELEHLGGALDGRHVALVFADTSDVMSKLDDPRTVISFEHRWADVVTEAASAVGAHAAWNICVYELEALRTLADPIEITLDLMRSHDTLWAAQGRHVRTGTDGARRILERLQPPGIARNVWRTTTKRLIEELEPAA
jgi:transcriptional regulator with XRE-family HTH domain